MAKIILKDLLNLINGVEAVALHRYHNKDTYPVLQYNSKKDVPAQYRDYTVLDDGIKFINGYLHINIFKYYNE
jgi:hypothetical protein